LLVLREGSPLDIYATSAVIGALEKDLHVRQALSTYVDHCWIEIRPGESFLLEDGRLKVTPVPLGRKRPRYATSSPDGDWVVGYSIEDAQSGSTVFFAPSVEAWTTELERHVVDSNCAFIDGTFWSADEMHKAGVGARSAAVMGHLPITGADGTAKRFAAAGTGRKVYVHINNTNPVFADGTGEQSELARAGLEVGRDGMEMEI
jgi:pyrroloquinoline quinone biosynthesis protein B